MRKFIVLLLLLWFYITPIHSQGTLDTTYLSEIDSCFDSHLKLLEAIPFYDLEPIKDRKIKVYIALQELAHRKDGFVETLINLFDDGCWLGAFLLSSEFSNSNAVSYDLNKFEFWMGKAINQNNNIQDKALMASIASAVWFNGFRYATDKPTQEDIQGYYKLNSYKWLLIQNFFDPFDEGLIEFIDLYGFDMSFGTERVEKGRELANSWLLENGYL